MDLRQVGDAQKAHVLVFSVAVPTKGGEGGANLVFVNCSVLRTERFCSHTGPEECDQKGELVALGNGMDLAESRHGERVTEGR